MRLLLKKEPQFVPLDIPLSEEMLIASADETEEE